MSTINSVHLPLMPVQGYKLEQRVSVLKKKSPQISCPFLIDVFSTVIMLIATVLISYLLKACYYITVLKQMEK